MTAVGLNFRDVLNVLSMYPGDPGDPGGDVAGVVTAAGAEAAHKCAHCCSQAHVVNVFMLSSFAARGAGLRMQKATLCARGQSHLGAACASDAPAAGAQLCSCACAGMPTWHMRQSSKAFEKPCMPLCAACLWHCMVATLQNTKAASDIAHGVRHQVGLHVYCMLHVGPGCLQLAQQVHYASPVCSPRSYR